jgi:hypothetical protein
MWSNEAGLRGSGNAVNALYPSYGGFTPAPRRYGRSR